MNTHILISFLSADSRVAASVCADTLQSPSEFKWLCSQHLCPSHVPFTLHLILHKHPVHWKPTSYPPLPFMFYPIIPIQDEKGLEPLLAYAHILKGWLRPGTRPVSHITRHPLGTQCPTAETPDTSDLCHLICDASEWQRGLLPEGLLVSQYEQWVLSFLVTASELKILKEN